MNSWDIIGDITSSVLWSSKKFRDANPKVYRAVVEALKEATDIINTDKKRAVTYYVQDSKTNMSVDELVAMLQEPHYGLNVTPVGVQNYADFMHKTGRLSVAPKSWKDMFFEDIHDLNGS
jgi:NitT/TauT family transport system substrate-binding protein